MPTPHDHLACYEGKDRDYWLKNNREIAEVEGLNEAEIFINQIQTRLAFPIEIRNDDDEHLGDAYVACLSQWEAEDEDDAGWKPLEPEQLVFYYGLPILEAAVVAFKANMEYLVHA